MAEDKLETDCLHIAQAVSKGLTKMREDDICTDFEVIVQGKSFRCHKVILASVSDYFQAMFSSGMKEALQNEATIDIIGPATFQLILDLLYNIVPAHDPLQTISDETVEELLCASDMFQMPCLAEVCNAHFARSMTASNCIDMFLVGKRLKRKELIRLASDFILANFEMIASEKTLLECCFEDFLDIIKDENLVSSTEAIVWHAISEWTAFDEENRQGHIVELLRNCCLTEINLRCLTENIAFNPIVRKNDEASRLVHDAICFHNHPSIQSNVQLSFRKYMNKEQVDVIVGSCEQDPRRLLFVKPETGKYVDSVECGGPFDDFACCTHGTSVYISGGNGKYSKSLHEFAGIDLTWRKFKREMPAPLRKHTMAASDGHLFTISGITDLTPNWKIFAYSKQTNAWEKHGEVAAPVTQASSVCLDDKIYIIGGMSEENEPTKIVQVYDISSRSATIIMDLPKPCPYSQSLVREDKVYTVTSNGDVYRLLAPALELDVLTTIADMEDLSPFGIAIRNVHLRVFFSTAEFEELYLDLEDTGPEDKEDYDSALVDLSTGDVQKTRALGSPMTVNWCGTIVLNRNDPTRPPAVPPRNYKK